MLIVRLATDGDGSFLEQVLAIAADWRADTPRPVPEVMSDPAVHRYIVGWPRPGDVGVVAEDPLPVGAAWWRSFTKEDPGFGFVDETIPEVSIGVLRESRGRGVGARLLSELVDQATRRDVPALSLSVEHDNPAVRLYRRVGFEEVSRTAGSLSMVVTLTRSHSSPHPASTTS